MPGPLGGQIVISVQAIPKFAEPSLVSVMDCPFSIDAGDTEALSTIEAATTVQWRLVVPVPYALAAFRLTM